MKKLKTFFTTVLLATATSTLVYANNIEQQAVYEKNFKMWKRLAEQGLSLAQVNLGNAYYDGQGVQQDYQQAAKWYQKAADQEFAIAQTNLGVMYVMGLGIKKDKAKAKILFGKACDNGDQNGCDAYRRLTTEK